MIIVEGNDRDAVTVYLAKNKFAPGVTKVYITTNKSERGLIKGKIVNNEFQAQMKVFICKNKYE